MTQKSMRLIYVAIITVVRNDCRIHFWGMTESNAVNRMNNSELSNGNVVSETI